MAEAPNEPYEPDPENASADDAIRAERKLQRILAADRRYNQDAYRFVFEALRYTQEKYDRDDHVSGQELCEGIRDYAIERFGMLSKVVLNDWGIRKTDDIGEIVFNLIEHEMMKKTDQDVREDFHGLYDLEDVFEQNFKFNRPLNLEE